MADIRRRINTISRRRRKIKPEDVITVTECTDQEGNIFYSKSIGTDYRNSLIDSENHDPSECEEVYYQADLDRLQEEGFYVIIVRYVEMASL